MKHSPFNRITAYSGLFLMAFLVACTGDKPKEASHTENPPGPSFPAPAFNADSAKAYVQQQVDFGPRVPNTRAHVQCGDWLITRLQGWADTVIVQPFRARAFDGTVLNGRNIVASFHPELGNRILLCAHWDTRPFADQDVERTAEPIDGANDGASGVGVLLEIARNLHLDTANAAVDIILFDVEDYGQPDDSKLPPVQDSYCLGSQHWARNFHVPNYVARFGILLDMVGNTQARFTREGTSVQFAPYVVDQVWKTAAGLGYGAYFVEENTKAIIDDHYYVNRLAGIKCIDIIHYQQDSPSNFWTHWHTHGDTMDKIDAQTLKAVGQTVLQVVYNEL